MAEPPPPHREKRANLFMGLNIIISSPTFASRRERVPAARLAAGTPAGGTGTATYSRMGELVKCSPEAYMAVLRPLPLSPPPSLTRCCLSADCGAPPRRLLPAVACPLSCDARCGVDLGKQGRQEDPQQNLLAPRSALTQCSSARGSCVTCAVWFSIAASAGRMGGAESDGSRGKPEDMDSSTPKPGLHRGARSAVRRLSKPQGSPRS